MARKLNSKEVVSFKELLMSEVIQSEALVNLLEKKGIISKEDLLSRANFQGTRKAHILSVEAEFFTK